MARGRGRGLGEEERSDGEERSDPDEFFRRFPGGFLFFPVVTSSGGGSGLQTIRSKIFTTTPPIPPRQGLRGTDGGGGWGGPGGRMGKVAELQTRGMAAAWSRKPINLYVCLSTTSNLLHLRTCTLSLSLSLALPRSAPLASTVSASVIAKYRRDGRYISRRPDVYSSFAVTFIFVLLPGPLPPSPIPVRYFIAPIGRNDRACLDETAGI